MEVKEYSGWSIADYVITVFALSVVFLVIGSIVSNDSNILTNVYFIRALISLFIIGIIASVISKYETHYEKKSERGSSDTGRELFEYISYYVIFFLAILVFWVQYYGSITVIQTILLALIALVIVFAFQGTKVQAMERGAGVAGQRERKDRDIGDYFSCTLSFWQFGFLLLYWIVYGSLPSQSLTLMGFQIAVFLLFVSFLFYGCYRLDASIPIPDQRTTTRRESVWGGPVIEPPDTARRVEEYERATRLKKPIAGVAKAITRMRPIPKLEEEIVKVWRSGEFIGNRMRYKVKVQNKSEFIVTDVMIYIISFPEESLKLVEEDDSVHSPKLEPKGLLTQTFDFLPTQDCVRGEINTGVSFVDMRGKVHTMSVKPFVIRSVCDLLLPYRVTPQQFELNLKELECGEVNFKIDEWTPEEMFEKGLRIVEESNFFEVSSEIDSTEGIVYAQISGYAHGKYTGKQVGVVINITGPKGLKGASCTISVSGEDEAMILPAIDDLRERLSAWLCPMCSSPLSIAHVESLRDGKVVECPFCKVTIGR
jgi:uncharacterized membrane protein